MRCWAILLVLAACGNYPKKPAVPREPMAACGQILRQCYVVWRECDAELFPRCESSCAVDFVYEDDITACVERCYTCTRERIACGDGPSCDGAREECEDGAHALVVDHDVVDPPELLCVPLCDAAAGSPADGCDVELGESCREIWRLADVSKLRHDEALFACQ